MHTAFLIIAAMLLVLGCFAFLLIRSARHGIDILAAANVGAGTHTQLSRFSESALTVRHLLVKQGTDDNECDICGAEEKPLGPVPDIVEADDLGSDPKAVELLGIAPYTLLMVASAAIDAGVDLYTAANGKVQELPVAAGTYYKVGSSVSSAGGDGDQIEVAHCAPVAVTVPE
ncbi:MAG: DUF2190 family protein [Verrucomicrobiales bacterium]